MFNLYNYGVKNSFFNNTKKISYLDHKSWFLKNHKSRKMIIFICFYNNIKVGYVKFDLFSNLCSKVSIILKKRFRNKGIASSMLNKSNILIKKFLKTKFLYAEVKKKNKVSRKFFLKNEFIPVSFKKKYRKFFKKENNLYLKKI